MEFEEKARSAVSDIKEISCRASELFPPEVDPPLEETKKYAK